MVQIVKKFKGDFELATVNTPLNKTISVGSDLEGKKAYLANLAMDIAETKCDADGALITAIMKKGDVTGTGSNLSDTGAIPGTMVECRRIAANTFETGKPAFVQFSGKSEEIPIVDGTAKLTLSQYQSGASSAKGKVYYNGTLVIEQR